MFPSKCSYLRCLCINAKTRCSACPSRQPLSLLNTIPFNLHNFSTATSNNSSGSSGSSTSDNSPAIVTPDIVSATSSAPVLSGTTQGDPVKLENSFHKRVLPTSLIALNSDEGKTIFKEALEEGEMECYFPLVEQFLTQSEPAYCAVTSLAMVMNALNHDPQRVWKGVWRWVSDDMLHCGDDSSEKCGHSLNKVKREGMNFREFETLAECHGVRMQAYRVPLLLDTEAETEAEVNNTLATTDTYVNDSSSRHVSCQHDHDHGKAECTSSTEILCSDKQLFESQLHTVCSSSCGSSFIIANFSRKTMEQTGDGHFSPIGGYNRKRSLVLIMDVARFKYPPYWVKLDTLWASMQRADQATGCSRGYFIVSSEQCYLPIHPTTTTTTTTSSSSSNSSSGGVGSSINNSIRSADSTGSSDILN